MWNPKNNLQEFVQNIGYLADCITYELLEKKVIKQERYDKCHFVTSVTVVLNMDITITVEGTGGSKMLSQNNAAAAAYDVLKEQYPILCIDWKKVYLEAQAGDALIKLSAYLTDELESTVAKSDWLQRVESEANLENIFNQLYLKQDPSVAFFGKNLGKKHKTSWIEALIWNWFSEKGIPPTLKDSLRTVYKYLQE